MRQGGGELNHGSNQPADTIASREDAGDSVKMGGIFGTGFGVVSRSIMRDSRLSIESKAIYAYFCAFAGSGRRGFPSVEKICKELGIAKARYYRHRKVLIELGYLSVEKGGRDGSAWLTNVYTIEVAPPPAGVPQSIRPTEKTQVDEYVGFDIAEKNPQVGRCAHFDTTQFGESCFEGAQNGQPYFDTPQITENTQVDRGSHFDTTQNDSTYIGRMERNIEPSFRQSQKESREGERDADVERLMRLSLNQNAAYADVVRAYRQACAELSASAEEVERAYAAWTEAYRRDNPGTTRFAPRLNRWLLRGDGLRFWLEEVRAKSCKRAVSPKDGGAPRIVSAMDPLHGSVLLARMTDGRFIPLEGVNADSTEPEREAALTCALSKVGAV